MLGIQVDQVLETFFLTTYRGPLIDDEITLVGHKQNFHLLNIFV